LIGSLPFNINEKGGEKLVKKALAVIFLFFILFLSFTPTFVSAEVKTENGWKYWGHGSKAPDYKKPKDGDINGDGKPDWKVGKTWVDDQGNDFELWVIDPDGKVNKGTVSDPYDEYFAFIYSNRTGKYFIGKCPFEGGRNANSITHSGDKDKNKKPDKFLGAKWRSYDGGADDPSSAPGRDSWEYAFNVTTNLVTETHYDKDGKVIKRNPPKEPAKWKSPGDFNDLEPIIPDFKWFGALMRPYPVRFASD